VTTTVIDLGSYKLLVTTCTPEFLESGKHFPENVLPRHLLLSKVHDKLIDVPVLIRLMLGNNSSVGIDEQVGLGALVPLPLVTSVQGTAVHTPMEHVVLLLEKEL
jgi:hypothetical protein